MGRYYPESNGKIERWWRGAKGETVRLVPPRDAAHAAQQIEQYGAYYNGDRLHSAIGYATPNDVLAGRQQVIWQARDRKLEAARAERAQRRAAATTRARRDALSSN